MEVCGWKGVDASLPRPFSPHTRTHLRPAHAVHGSSGAAPPCSNSLQTLRTPHTLSHFLHTFQTCRGCDFLLRSAAACPMHSMRWQYGVTIPTLPTSLLTHLHTFHTCRHCDSLLRSAAPCPMHSMRWRYGIAIAASRRRTSPALHGGGCGMPLLPLPDAAGSLLTARRCERGGGKSQSCAAFMAMHQPHVAWGRLWNVAPAVA